MFLVICHISIQRKSDMNQFVEKHIVEHLPRIIRKFYYNRTWFKSVEKDVEILKDEDALRPCLSDKEWRFFEEYSRVIENNYEKLGK